MNIKELSIVIVDDTQTSNHVLSKILIAQGIEDIRVAKSGIEALEMIKGRPTDCLIADWMMPNMDGLELTGAVRQLEENTHHYTYVIVHSAREDDKLMIKAFEAGVDDFVSKSSSKELVPRLYGATRTQSQFKRWKEENIKLKRSLNKHKELISLDPTTKLANLRTARNQLHTYINHHDSRGGCLSLLVIRIGNYEQLKSELSTQVLFELISNVGRRLRKLVRPMDFLARISSSELLWIGNELDTSEIDLKGLKRIIEGLSFKAFETRGGFYQVKLTSAAININFDRLNLLSSKNYFEQVITHMRSRLVHSKITGNLDVSEWPIPNTQDIYSIL